MYGSTRSGSPYRGAAIPKGVLTKATKLSKALAASATSEFKLLSFDNALELVAEFWPVCALGQNLGAILSHQYRMLELGREFAVSSSHCPVVFGIEFGKPSSSVDHRFDSKAHAR